MSTSMPALERKVEQLLRAQIKDLQSPSPEDVYRLAYEFEVRQSELEEQNEELRRTLKHLEAYRDRYVDLYDFAPLGYATLDQDGYLQEINLAGAKLLAVDRAKLTGYPFSNYVAKEDRQAFLDHVRQCVSQRREVTSELRLAGEGGRLIAVQLRSIPIEGPKDDTLCKTAITDITERRNMEEAIRLAQQQLLEQQQHERERVEAELAGVKDQLVRQTRLAAIGQISASIVHELRNSLFVVTSAAHGLKHCLPAELLGSCQYAGLLDREIATVNRLIGNLMEMARAKQPQKEMVDLGEAVREAFDRVQRAASVRLAVELSPRPFLVAADPVQWHLVLGNLMANAVEAVGEGGEVRVRAFRDGSGDTIVLEDDGPGVCKELRDRIFEPLFTTKPKGTGLGLSICRQIVEAHGGTIEMLDREGPGTAFQIRLPPAEL